MARKLTLVAIGVLSVGVANAQTVTINQVSPHHVGHHVSSVELFLADQAARPDAASYRISSFDTDRAVDALMSLPVTAGVESLPVTGKEQVAAAPAPILWFTHPSFYAEYDYINSKDQRANGADSITNSAVVGMDFVTLENILLGFTYSYSNRDANPSPLGLPDNEDSHFFSLYIAKSFWQWVNIGVSGGYGYTSLETAGADAGYENTWTLSPFVGLSHAWGPFSASLTGSSIHTWTYTHNTPTGVGNDDDETGKVSVALKLGYSVTERLKLQATAKYIGTPYHEPAMVGLPEDRDWATFGGKVTYRVTEHFDLYAAYAYDAFNDSYHNHNVQTGVTASW
jgi:Autotransporter beta-domain